MSVRANRLRTCERSSYAPSRPDPTGYQLLPATAQHYVGDQSRLAARIAAVQLDRLDELTLLGYPALDPATREVYEVALRLAARGVLES